MQFIDTPRRADRNQNGDGHRYDHPEAATSVSPTMSRPAVGIGEEADDGALAFTVTEVRPITAQGWLALYLTIRNIGDRAQSYAAENQQLIYVGGREFNVDINALEDSHNRSSIVSRSESCAARTVLAAGGGCSLVDRYASSSLWALR